MKLFANLFFELGMLGRMKRTGPYAAGVKDPETIAQHSHRAICIAYILAKLENADVEKVLLMALFHDFPESRLGDMNKVTLRYVTLNNAEEKCLTEQTQNLPKNIQNEVLENFKEFNERKTKEAIVAKDADLLECAVQSKEYLDLGVKSMTDWITNVENALKTESAKRLLKEIKATSQDEWWHGLKKLIMDDTRRKNEHQ